MTDTSMLSFDQRPVVVVYADPSALATAFIESLVAGLSRVLVVTDNDNSWRKNLSHLSQNKAVVVTKKIQQNNLSDSNYFTFIHTEESSNKDSVSFQKKQNELEQVLLYAKQLQSKALIILPRNQNTQEQLLYKECKKHLEDKDLVLGIVCTGDLYGPRMSLSSRGVVSQVIKEAVSKSPISEYKSTSLFPTYIPDAAKAVIKSLFSFGSMGVVSFMYSQQMTSGKMIALLKKITAEESVPKNKKTENLLTPTISLKIHLKTNIEQTIKTTLDWFKEYGKPIPIEAEEMKITAEVKPVQKAKPLKKIKIKKLKKPRVVRKREPKIKPETKVDKRWLWGLALLFVVVTSSPAFMVFGASSLWFSARQVSTGRKTMARTALKVSSFFSEMAYREAKAFSRAPLFNKIYEPVSFLSLFTHRLAGLGEKGLDVYELSSEVLQKSLAGESYDIYDYSEKIALELDLLYRETGFLQSEVEDEDGFTRKYATGILDKLNMDILRGKILSGKQIVEVLPEILGSELSTTYLILFQNNMELRPTGGFIGSYALITLDKGVIADLTVSDVYTADGQLRGHVEPPKPIKNYLGEANWFLRDSNWDPDFPSAATTAEWFLEKEIDQDVDGVISIDLEFARGLIEAIGPIYLSDFDKEINSSNLYEITQYEVEKDFFPGSQKKATFLTALTRQLLDELINSPARNYTKIGEVVARSLEEKHIQLFLHNKEAQRALADLNWDGGVYQPVCEGNCYADWLGMAEANVGVNKANYFIKRSSLLETTLSEGEVVNKLLITIENTASNALGDDATYKSYLRVLSPQTAYFSDIEILDANENEFVAPDIKEVRGRKEAGVYFEVNPGHSKKITFTWKEKTNLSFESSGEYRLYWRKQAGTIADQISAKFILPTVVDPYGLEPLSLTNEGILVYNTNLARDYSSRIFW